jgi:sucrose-phosphate synthase
MKEFADKKIEYLKVQKRFPNLINRHYSDASYVCSKLTRFFGIPFIQTGHSLERLKRESL